ncbi:5-hydroxytryptamine receptor 1F [Denticeps clupeoides]|uniref:G-protein coupled receptors family 1 profile domain-containing protein n=1 Tax=Denticeps clupeoides TaxID=299321 RepID=A0AAY4E232_9TELE|nr:5-hydroxytryptamine receptor 1F-like [Denticeps clupeoides]XP_028846617.1 5-hydroxytryptamine receptor 1F-like [Denticeps clupeoides]
MDQTNSTNILESEGSAGKILLSLILSILTVLTTTINSLVITAIMVTRKLHHPANYLICSLAVTDLLVAILVMPISIVYIAKGSWTMGQGVCTIWLGVDITCCTCSILHLAAIAVDRFWAITDAVEYSRKRTPRRAGFMIVVAWVLSILICLPPVIWRQRKSDRQMLVPNATQAYNATDECVIEHNIGSAIYSTFGAFYIPLFLILILYYKIYRAAQTLYHKRGPSRLDRQETNGHMLPRCSDREPPSHNLLSPPEKSISEPSTEGDRVRIAIKSPQSEAEQEKSYRRHRISSSREKKAATMLGLILGAFVICWLPFFIHEVIVNTLSISRSEEMTNFLTWLGYLNSLINPLIYTIFNEDFKKAFQKLVKCGHYL